MILSPGKRYSGWYCTNVYKAKIGGWRDEPVNVVVEAISPKRVVVISVEAEKYTGSKRQYYNPYSIQKREVGKVKLASSIRNIRSLE